MSKYANRSVLGAAAVVCMATFGRPAGAADEPKVEVVSVAPGSPAALRQGQLQGKATAEYRFSVRKGQALNISLTSEVRGVYFNVVPLAGGAPLFNGSVSGNQFERTMEQDGDYTLRVYLDGRVQQKIEPLRYRLTFTPLNDRVSAGWDLKP